MHCLCRHLLFHWETVQSHPSSYVFTSDLVEGCGMEWAGSEHSQVVRWIMACRSRYLLLYHRSKQATTAPPHQTTPQAPWAVPELLDQVFSLGLAGSDLKSSCGIKRARPGCLLGCSGDGSRQHGAPIPSATLAITDNGCCCPTRTSLQAPVLSLSSYTKSFPSAWLSQISHQVMV